MANTISDGVTTVTPDVIDGYTSSRPTRNVIHPILESSAPAVTLREAGLRSGSMRLLFAAAADADDAAELLASDAELTLTSSTRPSLDMTFVLAGDLRVELEPKTLGAWLITFDWQETE